MCICMLRKSLLIPDYYLRFLQVALQEGTATEVILQAKNILHFIISVNCSVYCA